MKSGYRESHLHPDKGNSYHATFSDNPYRSMVWRFEKQILDRILVDFYSNYEIQHFDFACGTGRILSYLEDRVKSSIGVDLSPSMLEVARKTIRNAQVIEADLTRNDVLGDRKYNLITAFRFFPNAEADLRMKAMKVLTKHLDNKGYIVFNNHRNTGSTRGRLARLFGQHGYKGMNIDEVRVLLVENHLEIVEIYPLCIFPASENHLLLPLLLLNFLETFLSKCRLFRNFGENLIFVCRKSEKPIDDNE